MKEWILSPDKFLSKDEVVTLLRTAEEHRALGVSSKQRQPVKDWMIIRVALLAGLRASELADLKVVDCFVGYCTSHQRAPASARTLGRCPGWVVGGRRLSGTPRC